MNGCMTSFTAAAALAISWMRMLRGERKPPRPQVRKQEATLQYEIIRSAHEQVLENQLVQRDVRRQIRLDDLHGVIQMIVAWHAEA